MKLGDGVARNAITGDDSFDSDRMGMCPGALRALLSLLVCLAVGLTVTAGANADGFNATAISTGSGHSCAIKDGGAWCWGGNSYGQLGNGETAPGGVGVPVPVPVTGLSSGVTAIAAGSDQTCAIKDGGAWCWGRNRHGQLGNGSTTDSTVPVPVSGLGQGVTAISAGKMYSCASRRLAGHETFCWGSNLNFRSGNQFPFDELSLTPLWTGTVTHPVSAVSAGPGNHTCVLADELSSAEAICWGDNTFGQVGMNPLLHGDFPNPVTGGLVVDPERDADVTAVSVGGDHTCLINHGGVMCQGKNEYGQLGDGTEVDTNDPTDGKLWADWVSGLGAGSGVTSILTGTAYSCALSTTSGLRCWGANFQGQFGNGSFGGSSNVPVSASAFPTPVTAISGSGDQTCAIANGGVWCTGPAEPAAGPQPVPEAPRVTIGSPETGLKTTDSQVGVEFTATGYPAPSCEVNGTSAPGPVATVPLQMGANTITVTCSGSSGSDTATIQVYRYSPLPVIITAPASGPTVAGSVNVTYTVNGGTSIPGDSTCEIANGSETGSSTDPTDNEVALVMGENPVTVTCRNAATSRSDTVTVTRYSPLNVAIVEPQDESGTIADQVNVSYRVNGQPSIPADSSCSVNGSASADPADNEVGLALGENPITVTCSNPAGSDSSQVTVYRNQAPVIGDVMPRTNPPGQPYPTVEDSVNVSFTAAGYPEPSCTVNGSPSSGYLGDLPLEPGENEFTIRCENSFGGETHADTEVLIVERLTPAQVSLVSPVDGDTVTTDTVEVSFAATGHPVPSCKVNDTAASSPATVSLELGANTITVRCQNSTGSDEKSITVIRHQVSSVSIVSPEDGFKTMDSQLEVDFTAAGSPVPDCEVNGESASDSATVPLTLGENTITVTCSNPAASASDTITVTRYNSLDVAITAPVDGSYTAADRVNVSYTVNGGTSIPGDSTCEVANGPVTEPSADPSTNEVDLTVEENAITITCSNQVTSASDTVTVTRHQLPSVTIDSPLEGSVTTGSGVEVRFTATGFPEPECEVNRIESSGSATVPLALGENVVRVICTNDAGEDSAEITVTRSRDPEPPRRKPRISNVSKRVRIGGPVRFRLHCETACRVAPTLRIGNRKRRLRGVRRSSGTHRISYRLRPRTVRALVKRKRNHPRIRVILTLTPRSAVGSGDAVRVRIGRR